MGDDAAICHPARVLHFNSHLISTPIVSILSHAFDVYPVFFKAKIIDIAMSLPGSTIVFYPSLYKALHLDNDYHAFVVELTTHVVCIGLSVLLYPFSLYTLSQIFISS